MSDVRNPLSVHQLSALLTVYRSPGCQLHRDDLVCGLHGMNHYQGLVARGLLERSSDKRTWSVTYLGEQAIEAACRNATPLSQRRPRKDWRP